MMRASSLVPALLLLAWTALSATQQASEVQTSNSAVLEALSEYDVSELSIEECLTPHEYQRGRCERPIFNHIKWVPITAFYGFRVASLNYISG